MSDLPFKPAPRRSQSGMVAIMVTLILMVVISLVVLGFAQLSRHSTGSVQDSQLSAQAYYAAESGVNDAVSIIRQKLAAGTGTVPAKMRCDDFIDYPGLKDSANLGSDVNYSCVLVNPAPASLNYSVGASGVVVPLISGSGLPLRTVTISWTPIVNPTDGTFPANPLTGCPGAAGDLPPASGGTAWACKYPLLRTEIVPTNNLNRSSMLANSRVNFLEPVATGSGTATLAQTGKVIGAKCTNAAKPTCRVTFSGLSGAKYYMHLNALYGATTVTITATDVSGPVGLEGSQAIIDATGNAHGVLRRVLVAVDLNNSNSTRLPTAALSMADSFCKRFGVAPGIFNISSNYAGGGGNPLCMAADVAPPPTTPPPSDTCTQPKDIMLTLDESSSMRNTWDKGLTREAEMKNVAKQFVQQMKPSAAGMHIGVVSFNTIATLEQGLTSDAGQLTSAITGMKRASGTNYRAGLDATNKAFLSSRPGIQRVMVFISDGKPDGGNSAYPSIVSTTKAMKDKGITVYTVGIYPADEGTGILSQMATSRATYTEAQTSQNLSDFFQKIYGDLSCPSP
ncbi:MAG TPA: VWA domain-containing protein [Candidatus Saccharimonadales bacterium]|nr:VWA domain-containing protein [Candidatus Saccharimonadales bacterium]